MATILGLYCPPKPLPAMESIATQVDDFGMKLEALIDPIVAAVDAGKKTSDLKKMEEIKKLRMLLFTRLGITVDFILDGMPAAILPFYSNKNHIFIPDFFRGNFTIKDQQKILDNLPTTKGTVDLEKAKLTGFFSSYEHPLYMNFYFLRTFFKFSTREIVAVMLHELGHGFYACYYANRTETTNQVLADVARHLLHKDKPNVEYVYKEMKKVTPSIQKEEVDRMLNGPKTVASAEWFKVIIGTVKSLTVNNKYDDTAFEQRADNFATRFGYGRELVTSLDKLSGGSPEKSFAMRVIFQFLSLMFPVMLLIICATTTSIFLGLMTGFLFGSVMRSWGEDLKDYTYDELKFRYLRIRNDIVEQLKNKSLSNKVVKDYIETLKITDAVIRETVVVNTVPRHIANFVFSGARQAKSSIEMQQMMEQLSANELFVHSAKFRTA